MIGTQRPPARPLRGVRQRAHDPRDDYDDTQLAVAKDRV
jgi:hypothetical protein